jgi:hypothetical protein
MWDENKKQRQFKYNRANEMVYSQVVKEEKAQGK